ncbi:C6 zinc finger protein [Diplogelasinospora grovesii]|uniref:C6 zinc finger protein n=1 Tax=Diplogelasinospora grovesii TaxID=303347 RepID=A0AAN6NI18_9PEZI|nr:C6 zinc finger protein [Diplogelasinospora grovesii]
MDYSQAGSLALLSLPALDDEQAEFDYAAFLQEGHVDDIDYLAEDSSASASTNTLFDQTQFAVQQQQQPQASSSNSALVRRESANSSASPSTPTQNNANSSANAVAQLPKQRLERRGHTKSRRGCFNCKRRRIKCQETRPACGHCVKTGLKCEYPTVPQVVHQPQHQIPLFSLQDMRFFQHFLFQCYPHHPIGSENIWTHEVPCLSQKYEYLMHAILGYSASELMQDEPDLVAPALAHRLKAIKAIKRTLSDVPRANSFEEGNALMATCFALTYQSVLLDDGMAEYMTFIRGIVIVAFQMYMKGAKFFLFGDFMGGKENDILAPHMEKVPLIDRRWVDGAVTALQNLHPLLEGEDGLEVERKYYEMLLDMARQLYISSWGAYQAMTAHYGWWMMLPHEQFQRLVDPSNQLAILLASHWIALKQIMAIITETQDKAAVKGRDRENRGGHGIELGIIRWLKYLNRMVDAEHQLYNQWPRWVEAQLARDRAFFGKTR